jgi:hypothetical protein
MLIRLSSAGTRHSTIVPPPRRDLIFSVPTDLIESFLHTHQVPDVRRAPALRAAGTTSKPAPSSTTRTAKTPACVSVRHREMTRACVLDDVGHRFANDAVTGQLHVA